LTFLNDNNHRQFAEKLLQTIGETIFDVDDVIRLCLVALYANGHVLLEGNPGMGKTELVKTLGNVLGLPHGRVQFTPDLMPSDLTGTYIPDYSREGYGQHVFQRGPVFTSLLLADEINRATPKTQSALLEAMAERQVTTVMGEQYSLTVQGNGEEVTPFMVLATQNPIDHEGTYDLPEAQTDRFMFMILMTAPKAETLHQIIRAQSENPPSDVASRNGSIPVGVENSVAIYNELAVATRDVQPLTALGIHIVNIVTGSNRQFGELTGVSSSAQRRIEEMAETFRFGFGPRAAIVLMRAAKAWSLFWGTSRTNTADGTDLAHVLVSALRHRMHMEFDWEETWWTKNSGSTKRYEDSEIDHRSEFLYEFCLATCPEREDYRPGLVSEIQKVRSQTP